MSQLNLKLITPPAVEPVTLATAKNFLAVDTGFTQDDALITALITAARQYAEGYTNRAFFNQQWMLTMANFPLWWPDHGTISPVNKAEYYMGTYYMRQSAIQLPQPTLVSVDSITYVDTTNTKQTLDPAAYISDPTSEPALIVPVPGSYWPPTQAFVPGSVQVTYTCASYGDGVTVNTCPQTVCTAIQLLVGHLYQNREAASPVNLSNIPFGVAVLLDTVKFTCFDFGSQG